ncbi:MAG TPA: hypothetical protein VFW40_08330 [Capsulimonadaceae bacterium]|nr:hypothetical protein [Capsulimonadaceae bacterium]
MAQSIGAQLICLKCGRLESEMSRTKCHICDGTLWAPRNVGGQIGNTNMAEAARLILAGKVPWSSK